MTAVRLRTEFVIFAVLLLAAPAAGAQGALPDAPSAAAQGAAVSSSRSLTELQRQAAAPPPRSLHCPGKFPSDLSIEDCRYKSSQRVQDFVTSSVSDAAMLGSYVGATVSQDVFDSVPEWPHGGTYFARRLGASYTGGVARGVVELGLGFALQTDPHHVSCSEDPLVLARIEFPQHSKRTQTGDPCLSRRGQWLKRPWHVILDSITVRRSSMDGVHRDHKVDGMRTSDLCFRNGEEHPDDPHCWLHRQPALQRFAGVYANAYSSYPWYPAQETTFAALSTRAALNFGFTFAGSFWTEYGSTITGLFGHRPPQLKLPNPFKPQPVPGWQRSNTVSQSAANRTPQEGR